MVLICVCVFVCVSLYVHVLAWCTCIHYMYMCTGVHWYCKLLSLLLSLVESEGEESKEVTDHSHPWSRYWSIHSLSCVFCSPGAVCSPSHHIKVATSMAVAMTRKRPDMWVRTVCVLLVIMEREIQRKEHKEETVEGGKDGGVEPTIVQSLLKLVSKSICLTFLSSPVLRVLLLL